MKFDDLNFISIFEILLGEPSISYSIYGRIFV